MRSLIVMMMFAASLTDAAWNGYTEDRELELDAGGVSAFEIEAGAGTLVVTGDDSLDTIRVTATIHVPDEDDALEIIEKSLRLSLDRHNDKARLDGWFESQGWNWFNDSPWVDLDVRVPHGITLDVNDGSGSIRILRVHSDVVVDDGSGSIKIDGATSVFVDDGSGSIDIANVSGDVEIDDGAGSITVQHVGGSVRVDDGSGSIRVNDIEHDLIIVDDGSGGLNASNVRGDIENDS